MRLEYEGRFLAEVEEYGLFQSSTSQAIAIDLFFKTLSFFDGEAQSEYSGYRTRGRFFVIGKSGDLLQDQVAAMAEATGWDGDLNVIFQQAWDPRSPVQIIVRKEATDKGRTYHNAVRVLRADWQPSRAGNVSEDQGRQIAARYSSALKSLVAKYQRQQAQDSASTPTSSSPSPPPDSSLPPFQAPPLEQPEPEPPPPADEPVTSGTVWKRFVEKASGMSEEDMDCVWDELIRQVGDGKTLSEFTEDELRQVDEIDPHTWTPF